MPSFIDRAAAQALDVKFSRVLLTVLAFPFYVLGWIVGLLVVLVLTVWGAIKLGVVDAKARALPAAAGDD
jgi:hypothetical protein